MQICRDTYSIYEVVRSTQDAELHGLMSAHIERLQEYEGLELGQLAHFIVFEHGDTVADLDAALGFPVMANRLDGIRFGEPGFLPSWEVIEEHIHSFECVYVLEDTGLGVILFVPSDTDCEMLAMFQHYARQ